MPYSLSKGGASASERLWPYLAEKLRSWGVGGAESPAGQVRAGLGVEGKDVAQAMLGREENPPVNFAMTLMDKAQQGAPVALPAMALYRYDNWGKRFAVDPTTGKDLPTDRIALAKMKLQHEMEARMLRAKEVEGGGPFISVGFKNPDTGEIQPGNLTHPGSRHLIAKWGLHGREIDGYIDRFGNFYDRKAAWEKMKEHGIVDKNSAINWAESFDTHRMGGFAHGQKSSYHIGDMEAKGGMTWGDASDLEDQMLQLMVEGEKGPLRPGWNTERQASALKKLDQQEMLLPPTPKSTPADAPTWLHGLRRRIQESPIEKQISMKLSPADIRGAPAESIAEKLRSPTPGVHSQINQSDIDRAGAALARGQMVQDAGGNMVWMGKNDVPASMAAGDPMAEKLPSWLVEIRNKNAAAAAPQAPYQPPPRHVQSGNAYAELTKQLNDIAATILRNRQRGL